MSKKTCCGNLDLGMFIAGLDNSERNEWYSQMGILMGENQRFPNCKNISIPMGRDTKHPDNCVRLSIGISVYTVPNLYDLIIGIVYN